MKTKVAHYQKDHVRNWLKSQADKMDKRADKIEMVWQKAHS
jgi:hypothetical protein